MSKNCGLKVVNSPPTTPPPGKYCDQGSVTFILGFNMGGNP